MFEHIIRELDRVYLARANGDADTGHPTIEPGPPPRFADLRG
jgi:hypothetical protein